MYYLIEITTYNNGTAAAYAVYAYDTKDGAVAAFHQKLSGAMKNVNYASELCMVSDGVGVVYKNEYWQRQANVAE